MDKIPTQNLGITEFRCGLLFYGGQGGILTIYHIKKVLKYAVGSQILNQVKLCSLSEAGISCTHNLKLSLDWEIDT